MTNLCSYLESESPVSSSQRFKILIRLAQVKSEDLSYVTSKPSVIRLKSAAGCKVEYPRKQYGRDHVIE